MLYLNYNLSGTTRIVILFLTKYIINQLKLIKMKDLKLQYEIELSQLIIELKDCPLDIEKEAILTTKISCYKKFIKELS